MDTRDLVVIGASAGGVEALRTLIGGLKPSFPAAIIVVLHVPAYGGSVLPSILERSGTLPAHHIEHGEDLLQGHIYVAPPNFHTIVHDGHVALSRGPRENGHRPAADVLFRTAARARGPQTVGVVLSGALDDGTAGLAAIRDRGGIAVVQDPEDALYPAMPRSAISHVVVDHVIATSDMPDLLYRLCTEEVSARAPEPSKLMEMETAVAEFDEDRRTGRTPTGTPAGFSCPDCAGQLYEIHENDLVRYRCRVGHAWSSEALLAEQGLALEGALWMALRSLEEKADLSRRLGEQARSRGSVLTASRFDSASTEAANAAALVRDMLESGAGFDHNRPAAS
jgi:two-component system, chemotaxis family, protein-glutamate methylesterase/glutaminase